MNRYTKIELDGSYCVMEPREAEAMIADMSVDEQESDYKISDIYMTQEEFENLPEFQGW